MPTRSAVGDQFTSKQITLTGDNETAVAPVFNIVGSVYIKRIFGVVASTIGANHTAGRLRLNDQTAQVALTNASGPTLSGLAVGTVIAKDGVASAALTLDDNAAGAISEPASAGQELFSPIRIVQKDGASTQIEYLYATTDSPTSGAIDWFAEWRPLKPGSYLEEA